MCEPRDNADDRACDFALLTDILHRFELHNRELKAKEQRLLRQLEDAKQMVAASNCAPCPAVEESESETDSEDDEIVVPCPNNCWTPQPPPLCSAVESVDSCDVSCSCSEDDLSDDDAGAFLCPAFRRPPPPPICQAVSDLSLDVTPSASETSSLGSLHAEDLAYLQQMEALAADERQRLFNISQLKKRERDVLRTAEVTRDVVNELQEIFGDVPTRKVCQCAGPGTGAPVAAAPVPPPEPEAPPPATEPEPPPVPSREPSTEVQAGCAAPSNTPHPASSELASLHSDSINLWAQTIAQNEIPPVPTAPVAKTTSVLSASPSVQHSSTNSRGQATPKAAVYLPTKTELRLAQNDDPFRVASKISRIPSLGDIPEGGSRNQSLVEESLPNAGELKTITDVLAGEKISAENASLVSQNLSETKHRLSFMLAHSKECSQCEKSIKDSLKEIDKQLSLLAEEFRQQHYIFPVAGVDYTDRSGELPPAEPPADAEEEEVSLIIPWRRDEMAPVYSPPATTADSSNLLVTTQLEQNRSTTKLVRGEGEVSALQVENEAGVQENITPVDWPESMTTIMMENPNHMSIESTWMPGPSFIAPAPKMPSLEEVEATSKASTCLSIGFLAVEAPPPPPPAEETAIKASTHLSLEFLQNDEKPPSVAPAEEPAVVEPERLPTCPRLCPKPPGEDGTTPGEPAQTTSQLETTTDMADLEADVDETRSVDRGDEDIVKEVTADIEEILEASVGVEGTAGDGDGWIGGDEEVVEDNVEETVAAEESVELEVLDSGGYLAEVAADIEEILDAVGEAGVIEIPVADGIESAIDVLRDLEFTENIELIGEKTEDEEDVAKKRSTTGEEVIDGEVFYDSLDTVEGVATAEETAPVEESPPPGEPTADVDAEPVVEKVPSQVASKVSSKAASKQPSVVSAPPMEEPPPPAEAADKPERLPTCPRLCPKPPGAVEDGTTGAVEQAEAEPSPTEAEPSPAEAEPSPAEAEPSQDDAEIALLQQVLLDQTAQIRMLVDVVKQLPILNHPQMCSCQPCMGGKTAATLEKVQEGLKQLQEATELLPQ